MRIISGKFKGRRFSPPIDSATTRPTTDMARESLFNILNNHFDFDELKCLELFAGTGAHSFELISRGATDVAAVEKNNTCITFVKKTAALLDVEDNLRIFTMDAFKFLEHHKEKYDFIFADPPFSLAGVDLIPDKVIQNGLLNNDAWFILEHGQTNTFVKHPNCFDVRNYGKTFFSFFKNEIKSEESE